jgi:dipeptidyl aminopeptidase/acylaminoacyl peptidase
MTFMKTSTQLFGLLLSMLILSSANAQTGSTLKPINDYIKPAFIEPSSMTLSPTGDFFAVIVPRSNRSDLVIFDRATKKPTANITPRKNEYIAEYWWVSDKRVIATFAVKEGGLEQPSQTGELWGIDADGKNNKYLFGYRGDQGTGSHIDVATSSNASATVIESIADDKDTILIGITPWTSGDVPYMELARLNIKNGRVLHNGGRLPVRYTGNIVTDHSGHVRLMSGYTADRYSQLFYKPDSSDKWIKLNDSEQSGRIINPIAYSEDNQHVYARVTDINNPDQLILLDPANKTEKLIFKPKVADFGRLYLTANQKDVYAIETYDGRGGYAFLKNESAEATLTKEMMKQFPGELVIANSFSRDGRFATFVVTSDANPGEYYLYDRDNKKVALILKSRPEIVINDSASVEPIEFKARDGLNIHGWLTMPNNANGKAPLVVLPHGGPYGVVDRWGYDGETQLLASRGYAVLQVNFRGSNGYGKAFADAGIGEWGGKMQDDVTDATKWLINQGKVDAAKVCIYGGSYGAYVALMAVATEPSIYRCAIGYSGVYDLNIFKTQGDIDNTAFGRSYLSEVLNNDKEWLKQHSPTQLAAQIKAPVLLIHGGADRRTPIAHGNAMKSALTKAGNAPEWIYKADEGHGFFDDKNRLESYDAILKFLDKHLK